MAHVACFRQVHVDDHPVDAGRAPFLRGQDPLDPRPAEMGKGVGPTGEPEEVQAGLAGPDLVNDRPDDPAMTASGWLACPVTKTWFGRICPRETWNWVVTLGSGRNRLGDALEREPRVGPPETGV
jgi:hypothetical protein